MKEPKKGKKWTYFIVYLAWILEDLKVLSNAHQTSVVTRIDPKSWVGTKLVDALDNVHYQIHFVPSLSTVQSQPF
jgi:hypothetical protein